jgi:hypothetical protein
MKMEKDCGKIDEVFSQSFLYLSHTDFPRLNGHIYNFNMKVK